MNESQNNAHPYTVTGIKSFRGREGYGFNATLHCNGRKVAFVMDQADGGMLRFEWLAKDAETRRADEVALSNYCATLAPVEVSGMYLSMDPDGFLTVLVEEAENAQRIARALKKHILFVEAGTLLQSKAAPTPALIAVIRAKHPEALILNTLPKGEAVALYAKHAVAA